MTTEQRIRWVSSVLGLIVITALSLGGGCTTPPPSPPAPTGTGPIQTNQSAPGKGALAPVYAPLADWLVHHLDLETKKGIGIDLGSGSGDLIVELAQRTPHLHWINADINPKHFNRFFEKARAAGVADRVSAQMADATKMPYRAHYADVIVSRGSFPFWGDIEAGFNEVQRILKPGGIAYIGRGFSEDLPVEVARTIRERQKKNDRFPHYNLDETEQELRGILDRMRLPGYQVHRPKPPGSEGVNYGIWVEWRK